MIQNDSSSTAAYSKNDCILIECSMYELDITGIQFFHLSYFIFSVSYFWSPPISFNTQ